MSAFISADVRVDTLVNYIMLFTKERSNNIDNVASSTNVLSLTATLCI